MFKDDIQKWKSLGIVTVVTIDKWAAYFLSTTLCRGKMYYSLSRAFAFLTPLWGRISVSWLKHTVAMWEIWHGVGAKNVIQVSLWFWKPWWRGQGMWRTEKEPFWLEWKGELWSQASTQTPSASVPVSLTRGHRQDVQRRQGKPFPWETANSILPEARSLLGQVF